jgi:hypothetical protein
MTLETGDIVIYKDDYILILQHLNTNNYSALGFNISQNAIVLLDNTFDVYKCNSMLTLTKDSGILRWSKNINYNTFVDAHESIVRTPTQDDNQLPECAEIGNCKICDEACAKPPDNAQ